MVVASLAVNGKAIAYMFGLSSALAVTHNLVNYKLVQHTSAVSATVIGEVKTIALIILSAFLLGGRLGPMPRIVRAFLGHQPASQARSAWHAWRIIQVVIVNSACGW